eukprot:jgi/Botrbrau1/22051/Bobra.0024s0061.1
MSIQLFHPPSAVDNARRYLSIIEESMVNDPTGEYFARSSLGHVKGFWRHFTMGYIQRYRKHVKASLTEDNQAVCLYFEYPRKVGILRNLHYYAYGPVFLPKVKFGKWLTIAALGDVLDAKKLDFLKDRGGFSVYFLPCTMPSAQGKGLGPTLLRHAVTEADERDMANVPRSKYRGQQALIQAAWLC